jgi:hypothetical protein
MQKKFMIVLKYGKIISYIYCFSTKSRDWKTLDQSLESAFSVGMLVLLRYLFAVVFKN